MSSPRTGSRRAEPATPKRQPAPVPAPAPSGQRSAHDGPAAASWRSRTPLPIRAGHAPARSPGIGVGAWPACAGAQERGTQEDNACRTSSTRVRVHGLRSGAISDEESRWDSPFPADRVRPAALHPTYQPSNASWERRPSGWTSSSSVSARRAASAPARWWIRLRALALGGSGHLRATMTLQLVDISRVESPL